MVVVPIAFSSLACLGLFDQGLLREGVLSAPLDFAVAILSFRTPPTHHGLNLKPSTLPLSIANSMHATEAGLVSMASSGLKALFDPLHLSRRIPNRAPQHQHHHDGDVGVYDYPMIQHLFNFDTPREDFTDSICAPEANLPHHGSTEVPSKVASGL